MGLWGAGVVVRRCEAEENSKEPAKSVLQLPLWGECVQYTPPPPENNNSAGVLKECGFTHAALWSTLTVTKLVVDGSALRHGVATKRGPWRCSRCQMEHFRT